MEQEILTPQQQLENHPSREFMELLISYADSVYTELGSGYSEAVYHKAFEVCLRENNIPYESQTIIPVYFRGYNVGNVRSDIIIRRPKDRSRVVVIEFKAVVHEPKAPEVAQLSAYLRSLKLRYGVLINFPQPTMSSNIPNRESVDFRFTTFE